MFGPDIAREQAERAAEEAGAIGGEVSSDPPAADEGGPSEADRAVVEAGGGESEGFEESERELTEHATHGDQHAARRVTEDAPVRSDDERASEAGEADSMRSSERET
jgi:hypothetical protein